MNKPQLLDKARAADVMIQIFALLLYPPPQRTRSEPPS